MRLAQAWPFGGAGSVCSNSVARRFHRVVASASQKCVAWRLTGGTSTAVSVGASAQAQPTAALSRSAQRVAPRFLATMVSPGFGVELEHRLESRDRDPRHLYRTVSRHAALRLLTADPGSQSRRARAFRAASQSDSGWRQHAGRDGSVGPDGGVTTPHTGVPEIGPFGRDLGIPATPVSVPLAASAGIRAGDDLEPCAPP